MTFTEAELAYLQTQWLGRLATLAADGTLQNNPVSFKVDAARGTIDIGGRSMGTSRKFRNVQSTGEVAFVVDEHVSADPFVVRGVEVRGWAEALTDEKPPHPFMTREVIRIHPRKIISWSVEPGTEGMQSRKV
jgi:pyridoxamine 5'-phosphate oxidase family protein